MYRLIFLSLSAFYIFFQSRGIYGGDAGDLTSAAYLRGTPHPPGFSLYSFLGYLLTKLPIGTVAWRVGFLSSLPSALTILILFLILKKIYKKTLLPLISVLILGFIYPFWLFAITVEVYALNLLFTVLIIYLLIRWSSSKKIRDFYLTLIVLGFALAHHQIILFLLPAFCYWVYIHRKFLPKNKIKFGIFSFFLIVFGFSSYFYSYLAAKNLPLVSWNNPYNLRNLARLILKETYGVFYSGPNFAQRLSSRFLSILAYFSFIYEDFTLIGFFFIILGFFYEFYKKRIFAIFIFLAFLFTGPVLYFYASFYFNYSFDVAIFEQFLTFSYIFLIFFICSGLIFFEKLLIKVFSFFSANIAKSSLISFLIAILFLFYPLSIFYINYPKLSILKNDFTADKFAEDILKTPKQNAILIMQRDNALFDTQYVYYTKKVRPDIKLFHFQKLFVGEYNPQIKKYYPELVLPKTKKQEFIDNFIKRNYDKFPIYTNKVFTVNLKNSFWIKYGLLYRFYKKQDIPKNDELIKENKKLWQSYQDPLSGSLGKYKNLFLSNILDSYKEARLQTGDLYFSEGKYDQALEHYKKALRLDSQDDEIFSLEGEVFLKKKQCKRAKSAFEKANSLNKNNLLHYLSLSKTYRECFKNEEKALFYEKLYKQKKEKLETPIEKL